MDWDHDDFLNDLIYQWKVEIHLDVISPQSVTHTFPLSFRAHPNGYDL